MEFNVNRSVEAEELRKQLSSDVSKKVNVYFEEMVKKAVCEDKVSVVEELHRTPFSEWVKSYCPNDYLGKVSLSLDITFDRDVDFETHVLSVGGFEAELNDGTAIQFDFEDEEGSVIAGQDGNRRIHFDLYHLDTDVFPDSKKLSSRSVVQQICRISECFVYTGEYEDPELNVVSVDSFTFHWADEDGNIETMDVPADCIVLGGANISHAEVGDIVSCFDSYDRDHLTHKLLVSGAEEDKEEGYRVFGTDLTYPEEDGWENYMECVRASEFISLQKPILVEVTQTTKKSFLVYEDSFRKAEDSLASMFAANGISLHDGETLCSIEAVRVAGPKDRGCKKIIFDHD